MRLSDRVLDLIQKAGVDLAEPVREIGLVCGPAFIGQMLRTFEPREALSGALSALAPRLHAARAAVIALSDDRTLIVRLDPPGPRAWVRPAGRPRNS